MFAATKQGGQCMGMPDVCKTPTPAGPVPVPYPNTAMCNQARGDTVSKKVKICSKEVITKKTIISQSTGDEGGFGGRRRVGKHQGTGQVPYLQPKSLH